MLKFDTILLIDDDDIANYINQDLISGLCIAYSIPIANNGREGLNYLKKNILKKNYKFSSLILLDLQMPVMDGYEFLFHYNNINLQNDHNVEIAILSSHLIIEQKPIKDLGVNACLQKPLTEDKILNLLKNLDQYKFSSLSKEENGNIKNKHYKYTQNPFKEHELPQFL